MNPSGEAMKYFRHILMSHEIFLKIFDGPQKFSFLNFFSLVNWFKRLPKGVWAQNALTGRQRKKKHVQVHTKSTNVYIGKVLLKIQDNNFLCISKLMVRSESLEMGQRIHLYDSISWVFFARTVLIDRLHSFRKGMCALTMNVMEK